MRRRTSFLVTLGLLSVCFPVAGQSLRQAADQAGMLVGAAVNVAYLSEVAYTTTLAREFNMLEPEDAMKRAVLRPNEETFDFTDADRIVAFAVSHEMKVRGHNLVWGTHNPAWLTNSHFTPDQLRDLLHEHIRRVAGRYRGKVFAWNVVNEAFDEYGRPRDNIWLNQPGIARGANRANYIEVAFRWTHQADPEALLFYNDADAETINPKSNAIYSMVNDFKHRGVPIDGIGLQMHIFNLAPDIGSIAANIDRFSKLLFDREYKTNLLTMLSG